jgi:hypothetical protein
MNGTCSIETHHEVENGSDSDSDIDFGSEPVSLTPREMLKSSTFYWLFAALFCCSFYGNLFYNLYKVYYYKSMRGSMAEWLTLSAFAIGCGFDPALKSHFFILRLVNQLILDFWRNFYSR